MEDRQWSNQLVVPWQSLTNVNVSLVISALSDITNPFSMLKVSKSFPNLLPLQALKSPRMQTLGHTSSSHIVFSPPRYSKKASPLDAVQNGRWAFTKHKKLLSTVNLRPMIALSQFFTTVADKSLCHKIAVPPEGLPLISPSS